MGILAEFFFTNYGKIWLDRKRFYRQWLHSRWCYIRPANAILLAQAPTVTYMTDNSTAFTKNVNLLKRQKDNDFQNPEPFADPQVQVQKIPWIMNSQTAVQTQNLLLRVLAFQVFTMLAYLRYFWTCRNAPMDISVSNDLPKYWKSHMTHPENCSNALQT